MDVAKKCGCKGIRTCLICEKDGNLTRNDYDDIKETVQYQFCYSCGLCWPEDDTASEPPLYLSHLTLLPEFVTSEEEEELKVAIDTIEWMPSQSGRRKQDFGPKVNFKKKKSKIGNFKGFPSFAEPLIKRFEQRDDLSDFQPVELCHLDYDPARGSAIEPHIDDTWIWGERLVTLNLKSPTVLTLTPSNAEGPCDCQTHCLNVSLSSVDENDHCLSVSANSVDENDHCLNVSVSSVDENGHRLNLCSSCVDKYDHCLSVSARCVNGNGQCHCNTDVGCSTIEHFTSSDQIECYSSSNRIGQNNVIESLGFPNKSPTAVSSDAVKGNDDHGRPSCTICKSDIYHVNHHNATPGQGNCTITENRHSNLNGKGSKPVDASSVNQRNLNNRSLPTVFDKMSLDTKSFNSAEDIDQKTLFPQNKSFNSAEDIDQNTLFPQNKLNICNKSPNCAHSTFLNKFKYTTIQNMCNVHRIGKERPSIKVLVPLPARSLVVLAGCSRHNWFHEIKRKDIVSRRLAMTFRELARDFMPGGSEEDIGSQLLELGRTFWETTRVDTS